MVINATHYLWFSHNVYINQKSLITYWKDQQVLFLTVKHLQSSFTFGLGNSAFLGIKYQIYSLNTCKHKFYFYKYSTETTPNCSSYKNSFIYSQTQRGEMNISYPITINKSGIKAFLRIESGFMLEKGMNKSLKMKRRAYSELPSVYAGKLHCCQ